MFVGFAVWVSAILGSYQNFILTQACISVDVPVQCRNQPKGVTVKRTFEFKIPEDMHSKLRQVAEEQEKSIAQLVREVLRAYLNEVIK